MKWLEKKNSAKFFLTIDISQDRLGTKINSIKIRNQNYCRFTMKSKHPIKHMTAIYIVHTSFAFAFKETMSA